VKRNVRPKRKRGKKTHKRLFRVSEKVPFLLALLSLCSFEKKKKVFVSEELNNTKQYARIRDAVVVV
jgi:hypothetical protein